MKQCEECGKTLGMLEGYKHPILGKKHAVCSPCFDDVDSSVAKWRGFVLEHVPMNESKQDWLPKLQTLNIPQPILARLLACL